jgi:hypothetical protein
MCKFADDMPVNAPLLHNSACISATVPRRVGIGPADPCEFAQHQDHAWDQGGILVDISVRLELVRFMRIEEGDDFEPALRTVNRRHLMARQEYALR